MYSKNQPNRQEQAELLPIIKRYFENPVNKGFDLEKLKSGSINQTYKLRINKKPYILQKLNSNIFSKEVMEDMAKVTNYLTLNKISCPHLIETRKKGLQFTTNDNGEVFRVYDYIHGQTPDKFAMSNNNLKTLGIYLAELHNELKNLDYEPKHKIDNFHNTEHYIAKAKELLDQFEKDDQELIQAMIDTYESLDKSFLEQTQLIHADTRIENILYDQKLNEFSIIDFDTVMKGSKYIDIGDLCRSLFISEDLDKISYKRQSHEKFIIGYYIGMTKNQVKSERISKEDFKKNVITATLILSLELALRFYIDYIEDNYFGYNSEKFASRKEHNLVRAENCYELFRIIHKDNF